MISHHVVTDTFQLLIFVGRQCLPPYRGGCVQGVCLLFSGIKPYVRTYQALWRRAWRAWGMAIPVSSINPWSEIPRTHHHHEHTLQRARSHTVHSAAQSPMPMPHPLHDEITFITTRPICHRQPPKRAPPPNKATAIDARLPLPSPTTLRHRRP